MLIRLAAAAAASLALCVSVWSIAWGVADLAMASPRLALAAWSETREAPAADAWRRLVARAGGARRLNPLDAGYVATIARLHHWLAWRRPWWEPRTHAYRRLATRGFAAAIARRPSWGFAWGLHAESAALAGRPPAQVAASIRNAARLGPWEPGVQVTIARVGVALFDALDRETRGVVRLAFARALRLDDDAPRLIGIAVQHQWVDEIEPLLASDRQRALLERLRAQGERR